MNPSILYWTSVAYNYYSPPLQQHPAHHNAAPNENNNKIFIHECFEISRCIISSISEKTYQIQLLTRCAAVALRSDYTLSKAEILVKSAISLIPCVSQKYQRNLFQLVANLLGVIRHIPVARAGRPFYLYGKVTGFYIFCCADSPTAVPYFVGLN
mmetsp:Transcript_21303/g.31811  ORF Transcript_21303/g.31811 Transcript_21303/m.31811 type:complete len:155 (-) Transcript_21303:2459-2923(-)